MSHLVTAAALVASAAALVSTGGLLSVALMLARSEVCLCTRANGSSGGATPNPPRAASTTAKGTPEKAAPERAIVARSRQRLQRQQQEQPSSAADPQPQRRQTPEFSGLNDIELSLSPELMAMHAEAVANDEETYIDPETGFTVMTRLAHLRRGKCCGSRCRHCPYNHVNVPKRKVAIATTERAGAEPDAAAGDSRRECVTEAPQSVVYTKGGDKGTSALFTGERRKKTDAVFEALGAVDELSSHIGLARAMLRDMAVREKVDIEMMTTLEAIQQELLNAGTAIATPAAHFMKESGVEHRIVKLLEGYRFPEKTAELEKLIDVVDARLEPLRIFILPGGGNIASAQLHVCRTTCRRAERNMLEVRELYGEQYTDHLRQATVYVNRLSDYFFVAARGIAEEDIVRTYE